MQKKWALALIIVLAIGMIFTGCASQPLTKSFFWNEPVQVISEINTGSTLTAELTNTVILGMFGTRTFPSIAETAAKGGITKIATVEYYVKPGVLNFWKDYTTIVTGE